MKRSIEDHRTRVKEAFKMRTAIYCRVSSSGQEDNSSLETQEQSCRSLAADSGWSVVKVFRDVHSGAELFERPGLTELRDAMRQDQFDILVVHALDRLSRKQTHQGLILSEAEHAGVEWYSATEDIDNSPQGQILRAVIGGMAEMERLKIIERTRRGIRARAQSGKLVPGARALFGYR
jgi:site-specific DNA recombinase